MCRWGCRELYTSYRCRYCGTNYCKACKRGDFYGEMFTPSRCRVCNQPECQGAMIDKPKEPKSKERINAKICSKCGELIDEPQAKEEKLRKKQANLKIKSHKKVQTRTTK